MTTATLAEPRATGQNQTAQKERKASRSGSTAGGRKQQRFAVTLTGVEPLILHNDSVVWSDDMEAWKNDPANKKKSRPGDDRTPAHRWIGYCYNNGQHVVVPRDNVAKCLMLASKQVLMPGGRGGKTFKTESMALMRLESDSMVLEVPNPTTGEWEPIEWRMLEALAEVEKFENHERAAEALGFRLFVRRCRVGTSKHVRVRPMFHTWRLRGVIRVMDEALADALPSILQIAGERVGLGDWRPSSPTPGQYGLFEAEIEPARE